MKKMSWLGLSGGLLLVAGCCCFSDKNAASETGGMKLIAHRGESAEAPENTMAAFRHAWDKGAAQGIEGDFYLTKDGELVCMHDDNAKRTAGVNKKVKDFTASEFVKLDVGKWKGSQWQGVHPPLLLEVLQVMPRGRMIFIELKAEGVGVAPALKRTLAQSGVDLKQVVVISFSEETLRSVRKELPVVRMLWLNVVERNKKTGLVTPSASEVVEKLKGLKADGVDSGGADVIDANYVRAIQKAGFQFGIWTIDDVVTARRFAGYGADYLTTNCPGRLLNEWTKP